MPLHFLCLAALAIDGDTLHCANVRAANGDVRLARIDAPEMTGHCRKGRHCAPGDPFASRRSLQALLTKPVTCIQVDASPFWSGFQAYDRYGRLVARCIANGSDLGKSQLAAGMAIRWPHN